MVALAQNTITQTAPAEAAENEGEYRLFWRLRACGAWRCEEFDSRDAAFDRFFFLVGKGIETRWRTV
jgi:hypothetical protein